MHFLISTDWVLGEAQHLGIHVSAARVHSQFERLRREEFPHRRAFRAFLRRTKETVADLLLRTKVHILSELILEHVQRAAARLPSETEQEEAVTRFLQSFKTRWKAATYCRAGYVVTECGHVRRSL